MAENIDPDALRAVLTYDASTGLFTRIASGKPALATAHPQGYRFGSILGKRLLAHRAAWAMTFGEWPKFIDHINRDRADNRIANLRAVTRSENALNTGARHSERSQYRGVAFVAVGQRWTARIAGKYLGCFETDIEAALACDKELRRLGVPVEVHNFPNTPETKM